MIYKSSSNETVKKTDAAGPQMTETDALRKHPSKEKMISNGTETNEVLVQKKEEYLVKKEASWTPSPPNPKSKSEISYDQPRSNKKWYLLGACVIAFIVIMAIVFRPEGNQSQKVHPHPISPDTIVAVKHVIEGTDTVSSTNSVEIGLATAKKASVEKEISKYEEPEEKLSPSQMFAKGWEEEVKGNYSEAAKWYREAAELGNAKARFNLGYMYVHGFGVGQDYSEAVKLMRKAAEQRYAPAQRFLGMMYEDGIGVGQDYYEAVKLYREAVEQGYAPAQYLLGHMYENGFGVSQDYYEAVKLFRKAAEQGDASGQCNLGFMYENGRGVNQDYNEALKWYRMAAEKGDPEAQNNLGSMYYNGRGVAVDKAEARKWWEKAAALNEKAKNNLKLLELK